MHIAWLGKKSPFCGNVTYSREVTNMLLDRGYQVSFIHFAQETTHPERREQWPPENGHWKITAQDFQFSSDSLGDTQRTKEVPLPCLYKSQIYTIPTLKSSKVLMRSLQALKPDLVHASLTLSPLDFLLPEICEELNLPLVATFHPPFDRKLRNLTSGTQHLMYQIYAPFLANYHRVIVFSQIQKDLLVKLGVAEHKVAIIPNGVDVQKYSPGTSRLKSQLQSDRIFVYQGRIATEKNVEAMLKGWKKARMGENCRLLLVGDGPLAPYLQGLYGLEDGIIWAGFIGDEDKRIEILRGSDVFILPSLVEGLSLSLLEAMACGVACIATDAGADGEVLENGAGVVLKTQGVSSQLQTLLPVFRDHPEMATVLGKKARNRVLEKYTLDENITHIERLYIDVVQDAKIAVKLHLN
ncbi:MAG: glycosyltransferase family 4 protein [Limnospira sp. PMC 1291.21]|uniref:Glycosyl transferase group 1 n=3 Tax=Limnospira TaxID=2596745 RepID=B5VV92_LIMMA|nr:MULTISPECIES: glycosyltransferase family 4 protein [Limnospira]MDC0837701.1 glycosyltransferase family 4 protein [Limnoraphis robusta]MDY7055107.1 glycosyltransferase family 4 protein [Limnospira fusiformis LS22]QJB27707.1 glycosyltransferase family 4 protein [Limnospira fusiformis SAG 85.79]UWU50140.1 Glycosyltransferase involved in cell wall bisynthesis [Arthrospira platensis C1]EDZ96964.1 glycosyl transferase group 1 [Limnospira maxima CS-328]